MTKQMLKVGMALALLAGCGGSAVRGIDDGPGAAGETGSGGQALTMDLRMRAKNAETFQNLLVLADEVTVLADGMPVEVQLADTVVDLAAMDHAARVATFQVPEGTKQVEFDVHLAPAGLFERDTKTGWVYAPSTTLHFVSPLENLVRNGKAVMVLDAAKSLHNLDAETLGLVPNFRVTY